jgi:hypothetical protein
MVSATIASDGMAFKSAAVKVSGVETAPLTFSSAELGAAVCAQAELPAAKKRPIR